MKIRCKFVNRSKKLGRTHQNHSGSTAELFPGPKFPFNKDVRKCAN